MAAKMEIKRKTIKAKNKKTVTEKKTEMKYNKYIN